MTDPDEARRRLALIYDDRIARTSDAIQLALEMWQFAVADRLNKQLQELYRRRAFLEIED